MFRICDVLHVNVNEKFCIDYFKGTTEWMFVNDDGFIEREDGKPTKRFWLGNSLTYAINNPNKIIRKKDISYQILKVIPPYQEIKYITRDFWEFGENSKIYLWRDYPKLTSDSLYAADSPSVDIIPAYTIPCIQKGWRINIQHLQD